MARARSRIQQELDAGELAQLNAKIVGGKDTIDDIAAWLKEIGHDIPRSNVGRHVKSVEEVSAQIRQSREMTAGLLEQLGPETDDGSRNAQLMEMMHVLIHRGVVEMIADPNAEVSPADLARLAKTLKDAASAQKSNVDRLINAAKLVAAKSAAKETAQKAVAAIDAIDQADPQASRKAVLKRIREEIYGIVE